MALPVFVAAAVIFTWPLALHPIGSIPAGSGPPTVALFGLFSMEWTGLALQGDRSYWDAPIFHPHQGAFAWSETQPVTALLVSMLSWAGGWILAYNLVLWLYLAAFGLAGYALARQLTSDQTAALWAGLWLTGGTPSIQQLGVLHLLAGAFPVVCLALIFSLARQPRRLAAWGAGLAYLLTLLTCAQFGLFLTLLLPFAVVPVLTRKIGRSANAVLDLVPLAAGLLLALPWLLKQRAFLDEMGFERSLVNVRGAYLPADLALPAKGHWLTGRILGWSDAPDAYPWDLGLVPLACIAAAVLASFGRRNSDPVWRGSPVQRKLAGALLLMATVALLLGFGPNLTISVGEQKIAPYAWLHSAVPGLAGVRTPSRFGMFASVGIVVLAALALAYLRRRMMTRASKVTLTAAAFTLLAAEMWAVPITLTDPHQGIDDHRDLHRWLEQHATGQPLIDLPMSTSDSEVDLELEVRAIRRALRHRSPVVNGYSGYFPETFRQLRWALVEDLGGRGRRYLTALGVRYALVHHHGSLQAQPERLAAALKGEVVFADGRDTVLRLPDSPQIRPMRPPSVTPQFPTQPLSGDILSLPISPRAGEARLIDPPSGHKLRVTWSDQAGFTRAREVRLAGSVLVDAGRPRLYVLLQRFPSGDRVGKAVLVSEERVARGR